LSDRPALSIVATLYRSAPTIATFYQRAMAVAQETFASVEMVLVNDGSPDDSLKLALAIQAADPRVVVVDLSRNFGHHKAMMTGLAQARGDLVFLLDSDLEEPPELLRQFHQRLLEGDCEVAYGVQRNRRGGALERISGGVFFWVIAALGDRPMPRNLITARMMTRDYVRALVRHRDREFLIADLWEMTGFRQQPIVVEKLALSPSDYSLKKRIEMAVKHVTTTSTKLLYWILYAGVLVFGLSVALILYYLVRYFTTGIGVGGFTSIIVSIWFFGGLNMLALGILGIYLANITSESKRRPYTVVRQVHRAQPDNYDGA
jgi:putative glycosyltransferase